MSLGSNICHPSKNIHSSEEVPNKEKISKDLNHSLMLVTALTPVIGFEKASEIAKHAYHEGISLKEAAKKLENISESDFDKLIIPSEMVNKNKQRIN